MKSQKLLVDLVRYLDNDISTNDKFGSPLYMRGLMGSTKDFACELFHQEYTHRQLEKGEIFQLDKLNHGDIVFFVGGHVGQAGLEELSSAQYEISIDKSNEPTAHLYRESDANGYAVPINKWTFRTKDSLVSGEIGVGYAFALPYFATEEYDAFDDLFASAKHALDHGLPLETAPLDFSFAPEYGGEGERVEPHEDHYKRRKLIAFDDGVANVYFDSISSIEVFEKRNKPVSEDGFLYHYRMFPPGSPNHF